MHYLFIMKTEKLALKAVFIERSTDIPTARIMNPQILNRPRFQVSNVAFGFLNEFGYSVELNFMMDDIHSHWAKSHHRIISRR